MDALCRILLQSKIRGLHAFGLTYYDPHREILVTHKVSSINQMMGLLRINRPSRFIAHCRYSTSGDWKDNANNQPIIVKSHPSISLAFNGVISMKTKQEMEFEFGIKMETDNDGEIFLDKIVTAHDLIDFIKKMKGSFSGVWMMEDRIFALRNSRRPGWYSLTQDSVTIASTNDIFKRAGVSGAKELEPLRLYNLEEMLP